MLVYFVGRSYRQRYQNAPVKSGMHLGAAGQSRRGANDRENNKVCNLVPWRDKETNSDWLAPQDQQAGYRQNHRQSCQNAQAQQSSGNIKWPQNMSLEMGRSLDAMQ